jgi:exosortase D (VPLPA-CTERM-specific)
MINRQPESRPIVAWILGAALLIAAIWSYWRILAQLAAILYIDEDYSFGLLLPLVSAYIAYLKWPQVRSTAWQPSWWGIVVLALGFALYIIGEMATDLYSPFISFVVVLAGLLCLLGGWQLVRLMAFPLLLLILMIPLPTFIIRQLTLPLQLISSRLATAILNSLGIVALRQGNIIDLGVRQLQVVAACSGLRYILALLALGTIYCYFYQRRPWKAALLIIAVIPAAIVANAIRVAAMGVYPAILKGFWHSFSGWLIFVFCFAFLALLDRLLNFLRPPLREPPPQKPAPIAPSPVARGRPSYTPYLLSALILVLVAGPLARGLADVPPVPLRRSFANFPVQLGPWQGRSIYIDPAMLKATAASAYVNMDFVSPGSGPVSLWIAYYENQKAGGSVHSPFSCLTGSGWAVVESGLQDLAPGRPVRYLVMDQGGARYVVYYWYLQRGRWMTSEYLTKIYLSYDGLVSRRADGALIRLITPAAPDVPAARERLTAFARLLVPVLPQFIKP